ncbi:MAG: prepilin-type N-terminal cleavage/methylation domain-containing protein [Bacilli bacterium]|nr:prepilin-type N-terminal cleavage/methylation domain-containing protein [Bacilli bacterium]
MNRKGFTLVELLATLVVLGIVMSIVLVSVNGGFGEAKNKTEDVFIDTIKDAMDMYLNSDAKELDFDTTCSNSIDKTYGEVKVYKASTNFQNVINSKYKPITQDDLVNPANKDVDCVDAVNIIVNVYRDEDFVYYYSIDKSRFACLTQTDKISNLPEGFDC